MSTTDIREALVELVDVIKTGKRSILHGMTGRETGFLMEALHKANTALSALPASKEAETSPRDWFVFLREQADENGAIPKDRFPFIARYIHAALSTAIPAGDGVPPGMVLVPREPTEAMIDDAEEMMEEKRNFGMRIRAASQDEGEER